MNRIITLTTDFGMGDGYVGTMKGVILSINPQATIVDITHDIAPQNIEQGAFLFAASAKYFPANAIHVVVVDPGVGSERRPIAIQNGETLYVGPDNGVLSLAIYRGDEFRNIPPGEMFSGLPMMYGQTDLPWVKPVDAIVHLNNPQYWLPYISGTFHGRDIFAPCAAHLSLGVPVQALGEPTRCLTRVGAGPFVQRVKDKIFGRVIHIDRFGNLITNIHEQTLRGMDRERILLDIGGRQLKGIKRTYSDVRKGEALALVGSSEHVEIAVREGSAAHDLGAHFGEAVLISLLDKPFE